jgi:hypothetical protein
MPQPFNAASIALPDGFRFDEVAPSPRTAATAGVTPTLGPLAAFEGTWVGSGFNTIFRPDGPVTPTVLPTPVAGSDNILELNLTSESLSFSPSLGAVPNRAMLPGQEDVFLNGVPYLQTVSDVTTGQSVGIHVEPGIWLCVPETGAPAEEQTLVRMASIPHGTTILAQGTANSFSGAPRIAPVDISPFPAIAAGGTPGARIRFASQDVLAQGTARIPQDLAAFNTAGTITQAILDDPNTVLRNHLAGQTIVSTTSIAVLTAPASPLFGGGTANIAFLLGDPAALGNPVPPGQNAQDLQMSATFWIETVEHSIEVPVFMPGQPALTLKPEGPHPAGLAPTFVVRPPVPITVPRQIRVTSKQIQYSQEVLLNFNGLSWPHVSVATLVPGSPQPIPSSAWS